VSVWLDDISRDRLRTGNLQSLMDDYHVVGVTSNPTIFAKALSQGSAYDDQVRDLRIRGVSVEEASRALTTYDIRWACDVLRPVYDATNGVDGRVSIEVKIFSSASKARSIAESVKGSPPRTSWRCLEVIGPATPMQNSRPERYLSIRTTLSVAR